MLANAMMAYVTRIANGEEADAATAFAVPAFLDEELETMSLRLPPLPQWSPGDNWREQYWASAVDNWGKSAKIDCGCTRI